MGHLSWWKLLLFVLGLSFCVFFGIDLATKGTERIQGASVQAAAVGSSTAKPQEAAKAYSAAPATGPKAAAAVKPAAAKPAAQAKAPVRKELEVDTGVNRIGNKAGDLLQITANHGIRLFIKLFEAILT
jgi:hypothetical protein